MAASAAGSIAHHVPHMPIPQMPRIRPPRMLKGTPSPNTNPQPPGQSPEGLFWVQGKWRNRASNAARDQLEIRTRQAAKALRHETHGLDIYAYRHIRTNQVVYSLTRTLQNTKVLKQLVFHGKKTVPASIRPDMWTPYYSIHFPPTPAGALEGLFAFQKLRELSLQRQLSPPDALVRVTQEDIDTFRAKVGSPVDIQELAARNELSSEKIPKLNEILPKKLQAKRLMDQKATSVADAAFVLDWISSGPNPLERLTEVETNRTLRKRERTKRARRRINLIREELEKKQEAIQQRAALAQEDGAPQDRSRLPLSLGALQRLSMDHHGLIEGRKLVEVENVEELGEAIKDWESFNEIDPKNIDKDEWSERQYVARTAERSAIKEWFETHDTPTTERGSVWRDVADKRMAALRDFDEGTEQRRRASAEKQAVEAAKEEFERRSVSMSAPGSLEQLIDEHKTAAFKKLEENERRSAQGKEKTKPEWSDSREIKMYWANLNDGLFAAAWPQNIVHGWLAPFAVAKNLVRGPGATAAAEVDAERPIETEVVVSKSVHVIGGGSDDGWMPADLATGHKEPAAFVPRPAREDPELEQWKANSEAAEIEAVRKDVEPKSLVSRVRGLFGR